MKLSKNFSLSLCCFLLLNFQCDDDNDMQLNMCDVTVVVDNSAYQSTDSTFYNLVSAEIDGDCLYVNISASGCDGNTWVLTLIDSEDVAESLPPHRYLKLTLFNNEACLAVFNKEQSFDLRQLRIDGVNEVLLNIVSFSEPLSYIY